MSGGLAMGLVIEMLNCVGRSSVYPDKYGPKVLISRDSVNMPHRTRLTTIRAWPIWTRTTSTNEAQYSPTVYLN